MGVGVLVVICQRAALSASPSKLLYLRGVALICMNRIIPVDLLFQLHCVYLCVSLLPIKYTVSTPSPSPPPPPPSLLPLSGLALPGPYTPGLGDEVDGALNSCGGGPRGIPCEVLHSGPYRAAAGKEATGAGSGVGSGGGVGGVMG